MLDNGMREGLLSFHTHFSLSGPAAQVLLLLSHKSLAALINAKSLDMCQGLE